MPGVNACSFPGALVKEVSADTMKAYRSEKVAGMAPVDAFERPQRAPSLCEFVHLFRTWSILRFSIESSSGEP